jgi:hypothetical protein
MEWNGMEWNGMEWNGMEWNEMLSKTEWFRRPFRQNWGGQTSHRRLGLQPKRVGLGHQQ